MSRKLQKFYMKGKYGKGYGELIDRDSEYLYSRGKYKTKIKEEELPEYFLKVFGKVFRYSYGYINVRDVVDIEYTKGPFNHLFKDDWVYLSYKGKIDFIISNSGYESCKNWDICVSGGDIIKIILAVEKYSKIDVTKVKEKVNKKIRWFKENYKEEYVQALGDRDIKDIFEYYIERGYVKI